MPQHDHGGIRERAAEHDGVRRGPNQVLDQTGLKGNWNFDVKWSITLNAPMAGAGDRISIFDAMEKQLGLKLEERQVPTPVIVVDSVNEKPSDNPPGLAEALPPIPIPTEFEVASVKPTDPSVRMGNFQHAARRTIECRGYGDAIFDRSRVQCE